MKAFICTIEDYHGNKNDCRIFADTATQAREKLIQQFPKHYVSPAVTLKEYMSKNRQKPEGD
jgi:type II secretory pathway component PulF